MPNGKIDIFCGTGGVGKTTLATSRALYYARQGKKVLLITIDPSLRLKQVLGLDHASQGEVHQVAPEQFDLKTGAIFALLMAPGEVMKRLGINHQIEDALKNPLFAIFTKPYGGMNEILAILEVFHHLKSERYDHIVLDTPPGKHFIDFLHGARKINQFFNQSFVEIFLALGKKFIPGKEGEGKKKLWSSLMAPTVKKLLGLLNNVTGENFVNQFIDAISTLYLAQGTFSEALALESQLADPNVCNWYLVTASDHGKWQEAFALAESSRSFYHGEIELWINRCLHPDVYKWEPKAVLSLKLAKALISREELLLSRAKETFKQIQIFPEHFAPSPRQQVMALASEQS